MSTAADDIAGKGTVQLPGGGSGRELKAEHQLQPAGSSLIPQQYINGPMSGDGLCHSPLLFLVEGDKNAAILQ
jgi:hypothetical protein